MTSISAVHSIANNILRLIRYSGLNNTGQGCNSRGTVNVNVPPRESELRREHKEFQGVTPIVDRSIASGTRMEHELCGRDGEVGRQGVILNDPRTNVRISDMDNAMGMLGMRSCRKLKTQVEIDGANYSIFPSGRGILY